MKSSERFSQHARYFAVVMVVMMMMMMITITMTVVMTVVMTMTVESLSNEDGNVNENVAKQWIKLQNTITARGNATTWPLFRRLL